MKTGIIGRPQVGKTSLFKMLTKADISSRSNPREAHIGVATVPDDRLDRLAKLFDPRKLIHAQVEYVDVAAIGQEALKSGAVILPPPFLLRHAAGSGNTPRTRLRWKPS